MIEKNFNNPDEDPNLRSRNLEDNIDHKLDASLETDPSVYKTVCLPGQHGNKMEIIKILKKGSPLAISVNMENFNIYIGSHHLDMQVQAGISSSKLCAGYTRVDKTTNHIIVEDYCDWRANATNEKAIKKCIALAIERDLL